MVERRSVPVAFPVKEPGVVAGLGARDVGVVCSLVGVLSLDSALGEVVQVSGCGASGGSAASTSLPFCNVMGSPVGRIWRRLRWRTLPFAISTRYERGICMLRLTTPGSHLWLWGLKTRTGSPGCTAGRGLEVLSYCNCCFSSLVWSLELVSPSADRERLGLDIVTKDLYMPHPPLP